MGVGDAQAEAQSQEDGEGGGDDPPEGRSLVTRPGAPFAGHDDRGSASGADQRGGAVEEVEVEVVDVEVDDHVSRRGQEPGPERRPVVGLHQAQGPYLRKLLLQTAGEDGGAVG